MQKTLLIILLLVVFIKTATHAQTGRRDSIIKIAKEDAKYFRLDKADLKKFRKDRRHVAADYFKPTKSAASDTALLKDSLYVHTYRQMVYQKTRDRRTVAHYVLWGWIFEEALVGFLFVLIVATGPDRR